MDAKNQPVTDWKSKYYEALEECLSLSKQLTVATQQAADAQETLLKERNDRASQVQLGSTSSRSYPNGAPWTTLVRERIRWFRAANRTPTLVALRQRAFEFINRHNLETNGPSRGAPIESDKYPKRVKTRYEPSTSGLFCSIEHSSLEQYGAIRIPVTLVDEFKQYMEEITEEVIIERGNSAHRTHAKFKVT
ncbi:hypothetical protein HDU81_011291 [Chytriomyces hyalinus]|nr:hypothetical protein HDU81_011291 [Chytriomyces hyalinus]